MILAHFVQIDNGGEEADIMSSDRQEADTQIKWLVQIHILLKGKIQIIEAVF